MRHRANLGKSYRELIRLKTIRERFEYLRIGGIVGESTFGGDRYLNQVLYTSPEWHSFRNSIIIRDNGCDLGVEGYEIHGLIIVHHINPLSIEDIYNRSPAIFDENNVICTCLRTHNGIHYGDASLLPQDPIIRRPGDTCEWKPLSV